MNIKKSSKIIKAKINDWKKVLNVLVVCGNWLIAKGMYNWQDPKTKKSVWTKERVKVRILEKEVYLIYANKKPVGTVTLSMEPSFYYEESDKDFWQDRKARAIYLSGLAVLPLEHHKGLATKLIEFAEVRTQKRRIKFIRFDTPVFYEKYMKWFIDFYLELGYRIVGQRKTPGGHDSYFFEKFLG